MRIIIDLDGVLCRIKQAGQSYAEVEPIPGAAERLQQFRAAGHTVVIQTARNMATQDGNLGRIMKNVGLVTLEWLERHGMEYDEIYFGKPNGHVYIDDRAVRFADWENLQLKDLLEGARER
jgi:capsule biosynthesis phosphatase